MLLFTDSDKYFGSADVCMFDADGDELEEALEDIRDNLAEDGGMDLFPTEKDIADVAYLAWELSGKIAPGSLVDRAEEEGIDVNAYQVNAAMDHLQDRGLVERQDLITYDVGESQQLMDPEPGAVDLLLSPFLGRPFLEDPLDAFREVWKAQIMYGDPAEPEEIGDGDGELPYLSPRIDDELETGDTYTTDDYSGDLYEA